jgi:exodeoxyribonuclease VII small subunit
MKGRRNRAFPRATLPEELDARWNNFGSTDWLYDEVISRQNDPVMISRRLLSPAADAGNAPQKFEELLARLEQIVSDMENAEMPLEKLLASYEEGMRLVKACGDRLTDAEQKVEILSRAVAAEPAKPGTPAEDASSSTPKNEIRLF